VVGLRAGGRAPAKEVGAEIAERLFIAPVTVRRHLGLAISKLRAEDRAAALRVLEESES
jgi:DNA-binding CsgD family transcriptional regulator